MAGLLEADRRVRFHGRAALLLAAGALLVAAPGRSENGEPQGAPGKPAGRRQAIVVEAEARPVGGKSWLDLKGLYFNESSLGRMGRSGDSSLALPASHEGFGAPDPPGPSLMLTGADLFRLNCASCHGESGAGSPPEIRSVIGPVQATSPEWVRQKMRSRGISIDPAMARDLASQSERAFRDRLRNGGERMPSFPHLQPPEVDALLAFIRGLGGVPGVQQMAVVESVFRVGEHVVKGTCHTCHAATGPGPRAVAAMSNAVLRDVRPSLAGMVLELSYGRFAGKVHDGTDPAFPEERGTMPVFDYLTAEEIRSAFLYLLAYPPTSDIEKASRSESLVARARPAASRKEKAGIASGHRRIVERDTGVEPATSTLAR